MRFFILFLLFFPFFSVMAQVPDIVAAKQEMKSQNPIPESAILPDVKFLEKTHPEKILFTQVKLAGGTPDFDALAKASPLVEKAQEIDKSAMVIREYNRIRNAFSLHDEKALIVMQMSLKVDEYSSLQDLIAFDEYNPRTFFKSSFYDQNIAIVPEGIERFGRVKLSKSRANTMFEKLHGGLDIIAEVILSPEFADRREVFTVNEDDFWLMQAKIAEMRLWVYDEKDPTLIWYHRSDWYRPEDKQGITDLYQDEPVKRQGDNIPDGGLR